MMFCIAPIRAKTNATTINLPFDMVVRSDLHEYNAGKSSGASYASGLLTVVIPTAVIAAIACSCPNIYAENPDEIVYQGDIFPGATHPQTKPPSPAPMMRIIPDPIGIPDFCNKFYSLQNQTA